MRKVWFLVLFGTFAFAQENRIVLHVGNESNPADGILGPYTYGVLVNHGFENGSEIEADYIRLHEPKEPVFESFVDEAQFTFRAPEHNSFIVGVMIWQNRMIDLYTDLIGLEVTREQGLAITLGAYGGIAHLDSEETPFVGAQISVARNFGSIEGAAGLLLGQLGSSGHYRKAEIEGSVTMSKNLVSTISVEEREFNFGNGGPSSEPKDEFILVVGLDWQLP